MPSIVVVDFGCPNTPKIVEVVKKFVREKNTMHDIYCVKCYSTCSVDFKENLNPDGIILSGGPDSVLDVGCRKMDDDILDMHVPVLGICYGAQMMVQHDLDSSGLRKNFGGQFGFVELEVDTHSVLFRNLENPIRVRMSHHDSIVAAPPGYRVTSIGPNDCIASLESTSQKKFAVQFHPEVDHCPPGRRVLHNFLEYCLAPGTGTCE